MARGDLTVFEEFANALGGGVHNLENGGHTIKVALIDDTLAPTAAATAVWATWSANEVTGGTSYTAGGATLANQSYDEADGTATFDADNVTWSQDGSGPTDIYYAIIYNDTAGSDNAIAFVDLAGPISLQDGDLTLTWNASGILTVDA